MTKESQAKIEEIAQQKEAAQRRVTEAKYNAGAEEAAPVAVNVTERAKLERQRHKLERLTQVTISVKAGVQHLAERLDGVKVDAPPPVAVGDASLVPVLQRCEAQLRVVLEAIRQEEEALVRDLGEAALQKTADVPAEPPVVNNNRVKEGMGGEEEAAWWRGRGSCRSASSAPRARPPPPPGPPRTPPPTAPPRRPPCRAPGCC